tara:strand:+ start:3030 stop:3176 length:147 start_codon:yes stop_codon:yes gene_type:complete
MLFESCVAASAALAALVVLKLIRKTLLNSHGRVLRDPTEEEKLLLTWS